MFITYSGNILCSAGVPPLKNCQLAKRNIKKTKTGRVQITGYLELKQFCMPLTMPASLADFDALVPMSRIGGDSAAGSTGVLSILEKVKASALLFIPLEGSQWDVDGVLLTGRQQVRWIGQLVARNGKFAVHMDGKYKLHHGKMILISIGTHHLRWDSDRQVLSHQYVPLVYLMCKQIESAGASAYLASGADHIAQKYFGQRLLPGLGLLDHCDGIMSGSLLTTHYSPLTTHHSPLTTHHSLLTTHYSLLTTHYALRTTYYILLATCYLLLATLVKAS